MRRLRSWSQQATRPLAEYGAALGESQKCLKALFESAQDAILLADDQARYIDVNPAATVLLGYTRDELLQRRVQDISPAHVGDQVTELWEAFLQEGRLQGEVILRKKDGSLVDVDFRAVANIVPGVHLSMLRDITGRKQAEQQLVQLNAALIEARDEAIAANQAKSEFLSRMSHELRTPLNAILGFGQMLQMDERPKRDAENIEQILKAGWHLLELINEILDIARIEAGQMSISLEPVVAIDAIRQALDLVRPLAAAAGIKIEEVPGAEKVSVLADKQRLQQVLLNLLSNAIKYNCAHGTAAVSYEEVSPDSLRIFITDTGPGITARNLDKLFIPFERLDAEQGSIQGTGIGLALSKRLIELMGGAIGVMSEVGKGSTFWVEIPLVENQVYGVENSDAANAVSHETASKELLLLYIEDNLVNLRLIEQVIADRPGVQLISAMQGRLGIDLARQHHPDLIFLDLHLPDMLGDEVLSQLRNLPDTREIPIVIVSADATHSQVQRLIAMGAQDYLTKPLSIKEFLKIVERIKLSHPKH